MRLLMIIEAQNHCQSASGPPIIKSACKAEKVVTFYVDRRLFFLSITSETRKKMCFRHFQLKLTPISSQKVLP